MLDIEQQATNAAQDMFLLVAVRALMETHPNPTAFRESWAHCLSVLQPRFLDPIRGSPEEAPFLEAQRQLLPVWQSYFPKPKA